MALASSAIAAQTDITISTDAAPATPRILGARVIGATPGSPFLHTVSATGQAPLKFAATDLPSGLSIDASSGTISGTAPAAGSYPINITASNSAGSASATLTLNAGSTLALTPPMGWNSYDSFSANVKESDVKAAADAMKKLLQPYGWNTIVIDYLWYDPEAKNNSSQVLDSNGRWLPSPSKYPSASGSFKTLASYVHSQGLSFGIHLMRGIPRVSVQKNTPIADSTSTASQAGNTGDTCSWDDHMYGVKADTDAGKAWYDSIYKQYADWGVDFVKVDDMMNPYGGNVLHSTEVQAVHNSIVKTGRSMILSLSPGPNQTKDVAVLNANANMWRTVNDFWDTNGLSTLSDEFTASLNWSKASGITPGHWPDADMLPLGTVGTRQCAFSHNQQVTVLTLWAIMPSPLMFGGQMTKLSGDTWTLALLTNEEVLAINQDALGARGKQVTAQGSTEVWAKDLSGGRKAVALFNRGTQDATVSATFSQLGVTGSPPVRDCWHRQDATGMTTGISANVPHEAALMYVVGDNTSGTGGSGGSTGSGGNGGGVGSGGVAGGADANPARDGASGSGGTAGSRGDASGAAGSGSGGATGAAGGGASGSTGRGGSVGGGSGGGTLSASGGATGIGGSTVRGSGGASVAIGSGGVPGSGGATTSGRGGVTTGGAGDATPSGTGGGAGGTSTSNPTDNTGCSCRLGSRSHQRGLLILLLAAATLAIRSRRRG
jgi:alpha-galactosidase